MVMSCAGLGQGIPSTLTNNVIAVVGNIFNVFSYDAVFSRDSNLSTPQRRADALRVESRSRVYI